MKKYIIFKIFLFFLFLIVLFLKPNTVKAQNLEVTCDGSGSCTLSSTDPLFSTPQDSYWYPGKSIAKTLRIRNNNSTDTTTVSTNAQNLQINSSPCQLDKQLLLSIVGPAPLNSVVWAGSLNAFYQQASLPLAVFSPGSFSDFIFTVALPIGVGNECQNQTTSFDLLLNFSGETISPIPTPIPTSVPGGGGAVLGAGVSAPTCNDTIPGGAPTLTSAVGGVNSITLTWTLAPNPVSYYLVAYGTAPGAQTYGNPNIGGQGTTSYTVNGLSGGTTYYFRIRAGNGCMPGPYSNELSATTTGRVLAAPAAGFIPGVLGVETQLPEVTPTPSVVPQILGTECIKSWFPWWIFLILELITILLILRRGEVHKWRMGKLVISLVAIAILSQIAHEITGCKCLDSVWCPIYIWINLAILLFSSVYGLYRLSKKKSNL